MNAIPPLGQSIYDWARKHGHRLPPYPSPEFLNLPLLPPAPCLPDDPHDMEAFAKETWRTALVAVLGEPLHRGPDLTEDSRLCIRQLHALGIPPAEYVWYRITVYRSGEAIQTKIPYPVLRFVYATTGLQKALEALDKAPGGTAASLWLGSLQTPRRAATEHARKAQTLWHSLRRELTLGVPAEDTRQQYLLAVKTCREEHAKAEARTKKEVLRGTYVW